MNYKYPLLIAIVAAIFFGMSCAKNMHQNGEEVGEITGEAAPVLDATSQFAFDFFNETLRQDPAAGNKLVSPLSVYMALAMLYNGADGETRQALSAALRARNLDIKTLNETMWALQNQLKNADARVTLDIANSIWYRSNSFQPLPDFLSAIRRSYEGTVQSLDFSNPASVKTINNWVSEKTQGKIPVIIDRLAAEDMMYLINAVYFKGKWQHPFKKDQTAHDIFHLADGSRKTVPFMHQELTARWYKDESFTLLELPYGEGKRFSMYIMLPAQNTTSLNAFATTMDTKRLQEAVSNSRSSKVQLIMPKWEHAYEIKNMQPELSAMGMGIAFTQQADFSKMYRSQDARMQITQAIHKTYIKVDEEGTEAAAVTGIGVGVTSVIIPETIRLDRPFMYAITEKETNTILFLGALYDPSSK